MVLPEIGSRVLAYLPTLRRHVPVVVNVHRATKFWGIDDGGNRWTGLSQWEPLDDEDVTGEDDAPLGDTTAGEDDDEDVTGEDAASNDAPLDDEDVTGEDDAPLGDTTAGEDADCLAPSSDIVQVVIVRITEHPDFQPRYSLDDFALDRYVQMFLAGSEPPPVELWWVENQLFLVHGHHRLSAARRAGRTHIPATIRSGSRLDAIKSALLANLQNGLPLNHQSLERACKLYLELEPTESNRSLARLFGLGEATVRRYRKDLQCEAIVASWVPGETRLLYCGNGTANVDRPFCLATFKARCFGGDDRWSVQVEFDSQRFYRNGNYPITSFSVVDDPVPDKPDPATFSLGDRVWCVQYGYGFIFYDLPLPYDQDFCRRVGLPHSSSWRVCFFPEWSGRLASLWGGSLEFVAPGKGLDLGQVLFSFREAIAQIPDDMPLADAERLQGYLNARIEWVKQLAGAAADGDDDGVAGVAEKSAPLGNGAAGVAEKSAPLGNGAAGVAEKSTPLGNGAAGVVEKSTPLGNGAAGVVDGADSVLDLLPVVLSEAYRSDVYKVLSLAVAELQRRGISKAVIAKSIRSGFNFLAS